MRFNMATTSFRHNRSLGGKLSPFAGRPLPLNNVGPVGARPCQGLERGVVHHCRRSVAERLQHQHDRQIMLQALSPAWQAHVAADHHPHRKDCAICLQAASRDRPHYRQSDSSFYALSSDISGPFVKGRDVGGPKKYFVVYSIRLPVLSRFHRLRLPVLALLCPCQALLLRGTVDLCSVRHLCCLCRR